MELASNPRRPFDQRDLVPALSRENCSFASGGASTDDDNALFFGGGPASFIGTTFLA
jgi:hypothetical protein